MSDSDLGHQVMWARFLALAVVPADTPLPMSMLQRLWALKSRSDAEATANMLEQLGVMKVACLADSTAWALVQPGHLKALHVRHPLPGTNKCMFPCCGRLVKAGSLTQGACFQL